MKRNLSFAAVILLAMSFAAVSAQAQASGGPIAKLRIPFAFNVGRTSLPAGDYTVTVVNPASDRKVLQVRSTDGRVSALVQTSSATTHAADNAMLVFHRYGDKYFFSQARMAGESTILTAVKSSAERVEARTLARSGGKVQIAIIAA
jgi:peptidyl-tRNA hydrolase